MYVSIWDRAVKALDLYVYPGCRVTAPQLDSGLRLICAKATSVSAASGEPGWLPASWKVKRWSPSGQPRSGIITRQFVLYSEPYSNYKSWQQSGCRTGAQVTLNWARIIHKQEQTCLRGKRSPHTFCTAPMPSPVDGTLDRPLMKYKVQYHYCVKKCALSITNSNLHKKFEHKCILM